MIKSVLVASRGVGACQVIRSPRRLSIHTVAVHSETVRAATHALLADRALCVGNSPAAHCYGQAGAILDAARITGVDAIHPGYGELSTNPDFAEAVARLGMGIIGPSHATLRLLSNPTHLELFIGAIDFTGDMPILLGPDGPSLGGFVCPATVVSAELWKLGQLRSGDRVRFVPISEEQARDLQLRQERAIEHLLAVHFRLEGVRPEQAILAQRDATQGRVCVTYRRAGDKYLLVEYGPMVLDLRLRFRAHALMQWLTAHELPGIIELTPGIRSLQIHFDDSWITRKRLLDELARADDELPKTDGLEVPSRIVHLPLSWDDPQTRLAIQKYTQSVRPDAPWCPSNIEFIRRINGLSKQQEVYDIVFGARYLVLGLGDVYLGAPVATPIDPRHRLVTTKYNPARTWTPENAVGIGGAYLCILIEPPEVSS